MTNDKNTITDFELATLRNNLNLLRSQAKAGRLDPAFLLRQIEKFHDALDRVEKGQSEGRSSGRFEALYNVSRILGSSLDLQTVLDQVMDSIIQLTGAERGFLMLRDDDGGLRVMAARNFDQQTLTGENFRYSRTVANQVLDTGLPLLTTNAAEDPRFSSQASIVTQSLRSIMAVPLRARGQVIGVVYVDSRAISSLFKEDDLEALDAFSGQAAVALDNARLFNATDRELSRRVEELQQLRRIDRLLNETLDADKAMLFTLEWACRVSGAHGGHLGLVSADTNHIRGVHHFETEASPLLDAAYPQVTEVISSANPLMVHSEDQPTVLIQPIRREQTVIGVVILKRGDTSPFTDEEQDRAARVIARAAVAIENAQLYAAVQAADRAKSEFVGIVAHDLKAPMNGIQGYAQLMLMQDSLSEKQVDYLTKIKDTVHRMEVLVSDLADISRIESGHFFMEASRVPVTAVLQAVKDATMPQIESRKHRFIEDVTATLPDMRVDYYRLLQVLNNLVSNAYKYTPDGGTIIVGVRESDGRVEFSVSDTGIGLSEEARLKLGTKFWRADDKFTRAQPGTGLGFSITKSLVEQMGSRIHIESETGRGSTFTFSVPVYDDDNA